MVISSVGPVTPAQPSSSSSLYSPALTREAPSTLLSPKSASLYDSVSNILDYYNYTETEILSLLQSAKFDAEKISVLVERIVDSNSGHEQGEWTLAGASHKSTKTRGEPAPRSKSKRATAARKKAPHTASVEKKDTGERKGDKAGGPPNVQNSKSMHSPSKAKGREGATEAPTSQMSERPISATLETQAAFAPARRTEEKLPSSMKQEQDSQPPGASTDSTGQKGSTGASSIPQRSSNGGGYVRSNRGLRGGRGDAFASRRHHGFPQDIRISSRAPRVVEASSSNDTAAPVTSSLQPHVKAQKPHSASSVPLFPSTAAGNTLAPTPPSLPMSPPNATASLYGNVAVAKEKASEGLSAKIKKSEASASPPKKGGVIDVPVGSLNSLPAQTWANFVPTRVKAQEPMPAATIRPPTNTERGVSPSTKLTAIASDAIAVSDTATVTTSPPAIASSGTVPSTSSALIHTTPPLSTRSGGAGGYTKSVPSAASAALLMALHQPPPERTTGDSKPLTPPATTTQVAVTTPPAAPLLPKEATPPIGQPVVMPKYHPGMEMRNSSLIFGSVLAAPGETSETPPDSLLDTAFTSNSSSHLLPAPPPTTSLMGEGLRTAASLYPSVSGTSLYTPPSPAKLAVDGSVVSRKSSRGGYNDILSSGATSTNGIPLYSTVLPTFDTSSHTEKVSVLAHKFPNAPPTEAFAPRGHDVGSQTALEFSGQPLDGSFDAHAAAAYDRSAAYNPRATDAQVETGTDSTLTPPSLGSTQAKKVMAHATAQTVQRFPEMEDGTSDYQRNDIAAPNRPRNQNVSLYSNANLQTQAPTRTLESVNAFNNAQQQHSIPPQHSVNPLQEYPRMPAGGVSHYSQMGVPGAYDKRFNQSFRNGVPLQDALLDYQSGEPFLYPMHPLQQYTAASLLYEPQNAILSGEQTSGSYVQNSASGGYGGMGLVGSSGVQSSKFGTNRPNPQNVSQSNLSKGNKVNQNYVPPLHQQSGVNHTSPPNQRPNASVYNGIPYSSAPPGLTAAGNLNMHNQYNYGYQGIPYPVPYNPSYAAQNAAMHSYTLLGAPFAAGKGTPGVHNGFPNQFGVAYGGENFDDSLLNYVAPQVAGEAPMNFGNVQDSYDLPVAGMARINTNHTTQSPQSPLLSVSSQENRASIAVGTSAATTGYGRGNAMGGGSYVSPASFNSKATSTGSQSGLFVPSGLRYSSYNTSELFNVTSNHPSGDSGSVGDIPFNPPNMHFDGRSATVTLPSNSSNTNVNPYSGPYSTTSGATQPPHAATPSRPNAPKTNYPVYSNNNSTGHGNTSGHGHRGGPSLSNEPPSNTYANYNYGQRMLYTPVNNSSMGNGAFGEQGYVQGSPHVSGRMSHPSNNYSSQPT